MNVPASLATSGLELEEKYTFPAIHHRILRAYLDGICRPDPDYPHSHVSSIYFDSFDETLLDEKKNSDFLKTKVRLRWYDHQVDTSFLEVKSRYGGLRRKVRSDALSSESGIRAFVYSGYLRAELERLLSSRGLNAPWTALPTVQIDYDRRRYMLPRNRHRIALDYNISAVRFGCGLRGHLPQGVLEIKGTENSAVYLNQIFSLDCRKESFSKYERACDALQRLDGLT